jgi:WD40 repeat protein
MSGSAERPRKMMIIANWNGDIQLWSTPDGKVLGTLSVPGKVNSAAFSPDGKTIVTAGGDARLWKCTICNSPEELIKAIETRLGMAANEIAQNNSP